VSSFNITNNHIITLESPLGELIDHDLHLIYYTIEIHIYKHLEDSVSFQCEIYIFSILYSFTNYTKHIIECKLKSNAL
jgi:hypothetical protein